MISTYAIGHIEHSRAGDEGVAIDNDGNID